MDSGVARNASTVCLFSIWWWTASLYRRRFRLDGGDSVVGDARTNMAVPISSEPSGCLETGGDSETEIWNEDDCFEALILECDGLPSLCYGVTLLEHPL